MLLNTLPLEGLRPILSLLDLVSLARLYITFDKALQQKLSAPNAFASFHLMTIKGPEAPIMRYVLRKFRSVKQLVLGRGVFLAAEDIPVLATLNPTELRVDNSVGFGFLSAPQRNPIAQTMGLRAPRNASFFASHTLPNLSELTPRLQVLETESSNLLYLPSYTCSETRFEGFGVPTSLVRFSAMFAKLSIANAVIDALPSSLLSLSIRIDEGGLPTLSKIVSRFPTLEALQMVGTFPKSFEKLSLPPSLLSFCIDARRTNFDYFSYFEACSAEQSNLAVVEVHNFLPRDYSRSAERLKAQHWLPPSVLQLRLLDASSFSYNWPAPDYLILPPRLASLRLKLQSHARTLDLSVAPCRYLTSLKLFNGFGRELRLVSKLEEEAIEDGGSQNLAIAFRTFLLPRSLTYFEADNLTEPSDAAISELPSGLTTLSLSQFDLGVHAQLIKTAPMCRLIVTEPIPFWGSNSGRWLRSSKLFAPHWGDTIDLPAWNTAAAHWIRENAIQIRIQVGLPAIEDAQVLLVGPQRSGDLLSLSSFKFLGSTSSLKTLQVLPNVKPFIQVLPRSITAVRSHEHVVFGSGVLDQIKSYTCTSTEKFRAPLMLRHGARLTVLDAPSLRLMYHELKAWNLKGMNKLSFTLAGIRDVEVVDFLTERVDAKTRSNMAITILYRASDDQNTTTDESLAKLLAQPMPVTSADASSVSDSNSAVDTIGSVVSALILQPADSLNDKGEQVDTYTYTFDQI